MHVHLVHPPTHIHSSDISIIRAEEHRVSWVSETDGSVSSKITADGEVFLASHLIDTDPQITQRFSFRGS